jgi:hypothetical protein
MGWGHHVARPMESKVTPTHLKAHPPKWHFSDVSRYALCRNDGSRSQNLTVRFFALNRGGIMSLRSNTLALWDIDRAVIVSFYLPITGIEKPVNYHPAGVRWPVVDIDISRSSRQRQTLIMVLSRTRRQTDWDVFRGRLQTKNRNIAVLFSVKCNFWD